MPMKRAQEGSSLEGEWGCPSGYGDNEEAVKITTFANKYLHCLPR